MKKYLKSFGIAIPCFLIASTVLLNVCIAIGGWEAYTSWDGSFSISYSSENMNVREGEGWEVASLEPVVQFELMEEAFFGLVKPHAGDICIYRDTLEGTPLRSYAMGWVRTDHGDLGKTREGEQTAWSIPGFGGGDKAFLVNYTKHFLARELNEAVFLKKGNEVYIFLLTLNGLINDMDSFFEYESGYFSPMVRETFHLNT